MVTKIPAGARRPVERVQTGVRLERRLLKVLKATAELRDLSLGDLLEGVLLHVFEGKSPFSSETLRAIGEFRRLYGLTLRASHAHALVETAAPRRGRRRT